MDNAQKKLLSDMLDSIEKIEQYLGLPKVFEKYNSSLLLQDAVERNLITIGEAMSALLKINPQIAITASRRIVDTRNKLTHGYNEIETVQVWNIIMNHLPTLKEEVKKLLND